MIDEFTSTGKKFWHHPEALEGLRTNKPRPVVTHVMPTDICQHTCAFCSVQTRDGDTLKLNQIATYLGQLKELGLKAVIISGGGNPILYPEFNSMVELIVDKFNLEVGLITNGMPLKNYEGRKSWKNVTPATLDRLTWIRISLSGLDHKEGEVYVPDVDPLKTTLGFSYVYHDIYEVPEEPHHGKVSNMYDLVQLGIKAPKKVVYADERLQTLRQQIGMLVRIHRPEYVRFLPNCLEPDKIKERCDTLHRLAEEIDQDTCFVQYKPPAAPQACYLGYLHPVLNTDGYVYPCDSCVLNRDANHKFAEPWRIARWDNISELYKTPVHSLVDAKKLCPGCVFTRSNEILTSIVLGRELKNPEPVTHPNFV